MTIFDWPTRCGPRSYSLTPSPVTARTSAEPGNPSRSHRGARTVTITVKAMPEGFLSTHLVEGVKPGTIVRLALPQGNFVLPDPAPPAVLFVTAGSGITPVMSMLRTLVRRDQITDIVHLHSATTADDVMFGAELEQLAGDHPGYRLQLRATRTEGRLDLSRLGDEVPDWRARQTWACGPEALLNAAEHAWSAAGIKDRLHLERFAVSKAAPAGAGGRVTFAQSGKSTVADAATSLMAAGDHRTRCLRTSDGSRHREPGRRTRRHSAGH